MVSKIVNCVSMVGMLCVPVSSAVGDNTPGKIAENRQLGSVLNNDIDNILAVLSGAETTPAEYEKAVRHLLDAGPSVLAQNVGMPDPVIYRSKLATTWEKYHNQVTAAVWGEQAASQDTQAACMKALLDAGTDPLTVTIKACRQRDVLIVASYRMNAEDFGKGELNLYDFGRENKHLRIPGTNCLDPAHPEVYGHRIAIFREVANDYDIDGIEFDFRRWTHMISDPRNNHPILTRMVRETRAILDEAAKRKGRHRLLLGVRVAPTIAGPSLGPSEMSCEDLGLDVKTWVAEGLVDYLCPSFFWGHNPGDDPKTGEFVALARDTNVGVYPTVFPFSKWQKNGPEAERIDLDETDELRRFRDEIIHAALKCYAEGADGISTFNWVPHHQPGMTRRNMRESWGLGAAKVQMSLHPLLGDQAALKACLESDVAVPQ